MTVQNVLFIVELKIKGGHLVKAKCLAASPKDAREEIQNAHPSSEIIAVYRNGEKVWKKSGEIRTW